MTMLMYLSAIVICLMAGAFAHGAVHGLIQRWQRRRWWQERRWLNRD